VAPQRFGEEGLDLTAPIPGAGEMDMLTGGTDKFILGIRQMFTTMTASRPPLVLNDYMC